MSLAPITRAELAEALGFAANAGGGLERGVAGLLRSALRRWGLSRRTLLLRYVREQLQALGLLDDTLESPAGPVLDQLVQLGECQEALIGGERYVVPARPRWIPTGRAAATLLGAADLPDGVALKQPQAPGDVVRRVDMGLEEVEAALRAAGVECATLEQWLRPAGYVRCALRRTGGMIREDALTLAGFWEALLAALDAEGQLLSEEAEVRVVRGAPGTFFGAHHAVVCEGRWSPEPTDGFWCGVRRGYGEAHWHFSIFAVAGHVRRCLDLYDADEWRWALLARGRWSGENEIIKRSGEMVEATCPLPGQLRAAMDILGERVAGWKWRTCVSAPDILALIE